jgi:hypothetical protein
MDRTQAAPLRFEPLGRLWQQAWLADVAAGGPERFADWLAALPRDLDDAPDATWRIDLLAADRPAGGPAGSVVVEAEPGGRCLSSGAVALLEAAIADLRSGGVALEESMALLEPAVTELSDSEHWPVPDGLRASLTSLAAQLADRLTAAGVQVADVNRLLGVPAESADPETVRGFDLGRAAAACLDVPRAVLASAPGSER